MPYSTTITALDLSGGVPDVRVTAGYTWTEVGGPQAIERKQDEVNLDVASNAFLSTATPVVFSYAGSLAPPPSPAWYIALWIQEVPRIANGSGWLFRSGRLTTEPPAEPIEVILAPEEFIGAAELAAAVGPLPNTADTTTITALTLAIAGADVGLTAVGTDSNLPTGVTFNYTATLRLLPNGSLLDVDAPFDIRLIDPSLTFVSGVGTGFVTAILNVVAGLIYNEIAPRLKSTVKGLVNAGVLKTVATRLNRGVPASMPAGVVLSIRSLEAATRPDPTGAGAGPEPVIGVRAALGAFGGVLNKFPSLSVDPNRFKCFIATAALHPLAPEVLALQAWRDSWLRERRGGEQLIGLYERVSPPLARFIARREWRRSVVRILVVTPAARLARRFAERA